MGRRADDAQIARIFLVAVLVLLVGIRADGYAVPWWVVLFPVWLVPVLVLLDGGCRVISRAAHAALAFLFADTADPIEPPRRPLT